MVAAVALALSLPFTGSVGTAASAATVTVPLALQDLCEQADELTEAGLTAEALDLISRLRDPGTDQSTRQSREVADACEPERLAALAASAEEALREPGTDEDADPVGQDICRLADRLTENGRPERALDLIDELRRPATAGDAPAMAELALACEDARRGAVAATGNQDLSAGTPAEAAGRSWEESAAAWLDPLRDPALAYLGVLLALLILARLLVFLPRSPWGVRTSGARRVTLALALILLLLAPVGLIAAVLSLPGAPLESDTSRAAQAVIPWALAGGILSLLLALGGALLLSVYLAGRLALALEVRDGTGARSDSQTSETIALLSELGAASPRGLEVPRGTDVTALAEGALPAPLAGTFATLLRSIVQSVVGGTPWRVTVDQTGGGRAAVVITRNAHAVTAVTVDTTEWNLVGADGTLGSGGKESLNTFVAAVVLATLAEHHAGFEELCGARDWRGIGLHSIATTRYKRNRSESIRLLSLALDHDPDNRPALVALQHALHREERDPAALRRYGEWLTAQSDAISDEHPLDGGDQGGYIDLHRRILLIYLVTVLNFRSIRGSYSSWPNDAEVATLAHRLVDVLADDTPPSGGLRDAMRPQAATLLDGLYPGAAESNLVPAGWRDSALTSHAPATAYNVACGLVRQGEKLHNRELREKFERAFTLPHLRDWARRDPELAPLRGDDAFRELVGLAPRTDYWQLALFAPHRDKLAAAGIVNPARLRVRTDDEDLRRYLSLPKPVFAHMARVARLVQRAQDVSWAHGANPVSRLQVEVLDELIARGVEVPEDIHPAWVTTKGPIDRTVARDISLAIQGRTWRSVDIPDLVAWLRLVRGTTEQAERG